MSAEVENQMTSVERIIEYSNLPSESASESTCGQYKRLIFFIFKNLYSIFLFPEKRPSPNWPSEGTIIFDNLSLRYDGTEQPVLKNISCLIHAREKVLKGVDSI